MSPKSNVQPPKSAERASLLAKPSSVSMDWDGLPAKLSALNVHKTTVSSTLSLWERVRGRGIEFSIAQKTNQSNQTFLRPKVQAQRQLASVTDFGLWTLDFGLELNAC